MQTLENSLVKQGFKLPLPARPAKGESSPATMRLVYAATGEPLADVPDTPAEAADALVEKAKLAFEKGLWCRMLPAQRAQIMGRIADLTLKHVEELAILHTLETGVPIAQARAVHVPRSAENFRFFGELGNSLAGESYEQTGRYLTVVTREPIGIGLLISPWNAPLALSSMKIAACISTGSSIIVKPSEYTPLSVLRLAEIIQEAGVPEGVVQVATGPGEQIGSALVSHPGIGAVGFVGGTATGKRIMQAASGSLKKIGLELGGKSANIILASANLDRAVDGSLLAAFGNNGQQCLAGSRIFVEEAIADAFIAKFVARAKAIRVGDPFLPETELGPLAFKAHFDKVCAFAEEAHQQPGYRVLAGGKPADIPGGGLFFEPTIVEADENSSRLCQEEIFGPFVMIQRVRDLDEALARANDSDFGLVGYIWSDHLPSVMRVRRELRTGTVWVNTPVARDLRAPFGGFKQSGIGRDGLPGSVELFTEEKSVMLPQDEFPMMRMGLAKEILMS
jgi:acyl-CoA reductase-like NAD-dependent aldehyde dehydrogenase